MIRTALTVTLAAALAAIPAPRTDAATFNTVTRVNVLRQYNSSGAFVVNTSNTSLSPGQSLSNGGGGFTPGGAIDGGGSNTQTPSGTFTTGSSVISQEFTLPGSRRVGSYSVDFLGGSNKPSNFLIEGFTGSGYVTLASFTPGASTNNAATFAATDVTKIRYTATGPALNGTFFTLNEMKVFLASDAPATQYDAGFNILQDTGLIAQTFTSTYAANGTAGFVGTAGNAGSIVDTDATSSNVNAQNVQTGPPAASKAFVAYKFTQPIFIRNGTLGGFHGQGWDPGGWQFWTSNLPNPDPANDADWFLQFTDPPGGGVVTRDFLLAIPRSWLNARLTWNVQSGAVSNFELFGAPEPASLALLAMGGLMSMSRRNRRA